MAPVDNGQGGMLTQAEEGMKLFEAQQGTAAEAPGGDVESWGCDRNGEKDGDERYVVLHYEDIMKNYNYS